MKRGQTTIDFAVGASVFLLTLLLVITFSSSLFSPFEGQQEDVLLKNRIASELTHQILLDPSDTSNYVLDEDCTAYMFEQSSGGVGSYPQTGCVFEDGDTFESETPVAAESIGAKDLNVSVEEIDGGPITLDANDGGSVMAVYGPEPEQGQRTIEVARRDVYLNGKMYRLYVRVW